MSNLANKVVVMTGASGGIGAAVAEQLALERCKLGLIGRNETRLQELAERVRSAGAEAKYCCADVCDSQDLGKAMGQLSSQLGPVDTLIVCAGLGDVDQMEPFRAEHYERLMRVNWVGLVNAIEPVLGDMLERGSGHLVAVSSLRAYKGLPGLAGYSATKAAVNTFMDGLRVDLRDRGIRVTTICPGFVRTPMTDSKDFPKPWIMEPGPAAKRIVRAVRQQRKVCNFPWQAHWLMRLSGHMPDWVLAKLAPR